MKGRQSITERSEDMFGSDTFLQRVGAAVVIGLLVVVLLLFLWYVVDVLLVVFAAVLFSIFLNAIARFLNRTTKLPYKAALGVTLLVLVSVIALVIWLLAPAVSLQFRQLSAELPKALAIVGGEVMDNGLGRKMLGEITVQEVLGGVPTRAVSIFSNVVSAVASLILVLVLGIYFALEPKTYRAGLVKLFPVKKRHRADMVLDSMHFSLQRWLIGTFISMATVGFLVFIGLWLLDVPLALSLGLLAGLMEFIPVVGFLIAAVPAVLITLLANPGMTLWVILLLLAVQFVQNYFVSPYIFKKAVFLAPALILIMQVLAGVLFGFLGVMFATPLLIVVTILIKMLYVEDILGDETTVAGRK